MFLANSKRQIPDTLNSFYISLKFVKSKYRAFKLSLQSSNLCLQILESNTTKKQKICLKQKQYPQFSY